MANRRFSILLGMLIAAALAASKAMAQSDDANPGANISGVWLLDGATATFSAEAPPPMTSWGAQRFAANRPTVGENAVLDANDPTLDCHPPGVPYVLTIPTPFEFLVVDGQILQIFEYNHFVRRIYTDGRELPADLELTGMYQWMGYSLGRWEGDTLVIETTGFNDRTWLDRSGRPHSRELVVVERIRRTDRDTLIDEITIFDPQTYTAPWQGRLVFKLKEDWEIFEHACITDTGVSEGYLEFKSRAWQPGD